MKIPITRENAFKIINTTSLQESSTPGVPLDFRGVSLTYEDLSNRDFTGADFTDADLTGSNLSGAKLFKAKFVRASLVKSNLQNADLTGADLTSANLEEIDGKNLGLGMVTLRNARLFNADLDHSTLTKADLKDADLRCANLKQARMREACLENADLTNALLGGADLALCNVKNGVFRNAELREARLRQIDNFESADWIGVDISSINFAGAYRLRRFVIDQNYLKEFRESSRFSGVLYFFWWVTSDCGRSILRWCSWTMALCIFFAWLYTFVGVDYKGGADFLSALYYSVVTLTTLGYGDIVPVTTMARVIAMIEVIIGYIMLGGLLSIFSNKLARRGE